MGTMDTILMLGAVGIGAYVLYQNWGTISQGFGQQQAYGQPTTFDQSLTFEQPTSGTPEEGDCTAAGTGVCCTDNAGNRCYKGSTSEGVKYECDQQGDTSCDELRDRFVDQWAVTGGKTYDFTKKRGLVDVLRKDCNAFGGSCTSECDGSNPNLCAACVGACGTAAKGTPKVKTTRGTRDPITGKTPQYIPAGQFKYRTNVAGYEELVQGAPGRCQHLVGAPAAYHACVTNQVGAYTYGPQDGTYQNYEDLDEYGSYSTYWNRNANLAGRAPMRITFG